MNTKNKLEAICNKYCSINHNDDNYSIGGGLDGSKFASRRHEDARKDEGKLTLGEATQIFKKATGLDADAVRQVLKYATPNMEWHHAGKLPKAYGGGMKKTYFLNGEEICDCAKNWDANVQKLNFSKTVAREAVENKKSLEEIKLEFLKVNAKSISRTATIPKFFYETDREMNGKHGWFSSYGKNYNMTEYYSGWEFENAEMYYQFLIIE
jgi:hypothetical protein